MLLWDILFAFYTIAGPAFASSDGDGDGDRLCRHHPPCLLDPWWIQPVAINLDIFSMTAAYAHTDETTTLRADLHVQNPDHNLTAYSKAITSCEINTSRRRTNMQRRVPEGKSLSGIGGLSSGMFASSSSFHAF
ncbi:uncharacterized protein BDV17DRAFT_295802 [Aspergillus undulatus]|uniref:uncharacterized protein n=1 Tax=Aspergillus undulatus TaxID=1810928 RepID=UPI003CCDD107